MPNNALKPHQEAPQVGVRQMAYGAWAAVSPWRTQHVGGADRWPPGRRPTFGSFQSPREWAFLLGLTLG